MEKILTFLVVITLLPLKSCAPLVVTNLEQTLPYPADDESVKVYGLGTEIPVDAEVIGTVKVGDTGFTATRNCSFQEILNSAKAEAKKAGGNAIKLTDHVPPGHSTCHKITAKILRLNTIKATAFNETGPHSDYAVFNIFSASGTSDIEYNLHLGDMVICSINNKLKTTIAVRENGLSTIWAEIDKRSELQINIEFGQTYYLKCDLTTLDGDKQPSIELVDPKVGSSEFGLFR